MAKGESGRVVIEVEPQLKHEIHKIVALQDKTLKDWFIEKAQEEISSFSQPALFRDTHSGESSLEKGGIES